MDEDIEKRLALIEIQDSKAEKRYAEANRLLKMPFIKRIQEKSMKETLEQVHETQKNTFLKRCKKDEVHKEDWEDEFCLFWIEFLEGKCKSINQYLKRLNYSNQ